MGVLKSKQNCLIVCALTPTLLTQLLQTECWSRANFEGAPAPAPELFAILSLLRFQLRS